MKSFSKSFFYVPNRNTKIEEGALLIAEPFMRDKWFGRSVILLIDNGEEGTTGLILNNELETTLDEVLGGDISTEGIKVYCGGPVGHDQLIFVHNLGEHIIPGGHEVAPGLWVGGNYEAMKEYVNLGYPTEGSIRFMIGYSGWSAGQLAGEMNSNSWALTHRRPDSHELLSGAGDKYWHKIVKGLGENYRPWQLLPADFRAN